MATMPLRSGCTSLQQRQVLIVIRKWHRGFTESGQVSCYWVLLVVLSLRSHLAGQPVLELQPLPLASLLAHRPHVHQPVRQPFARHAVRQHLLQRRRSKRSVRLVRRHWPRVVLRPPLHRVLVVVLGRGEDVQPEAPAALRRTLVTAAAVVLPGALRRRRRVCCISS